MPEAAADPTPAAVSALVEVTSRPVAVARPREAVEDLLEAVVAAAEARLGLAWMRHPRDGAGDVVAAAGLDVETLQALAAAAARTPAPDDPLPVAVADGGPLAAALAGAGAAHGLVIAAGAGEAPAGLVVLGGDAPLAAEPLRRHAARVGAERIGTLLEVALLRENLERAMAQILATDERMLGRIGLDIHDGPTQQLSVALLEVQLLESDLADAEAAGRGAPESLRPALGRIYETVGGALHEMRELIGHLRPAQFEDRSLRDILQDAIAGFENRTDCRVDAVWDGRFEVNGVSITQRITLYRILQETLTNAHRHGAASRVRVRVSETPSGTTLEVADDGSGFDPDAVRRNRPGMPLARFGLHGMRDRAQILGGSFDVESAAGVGTTVRVFLPRWNGPSAEVPVDAA